MADLTMEILKHTPLRPVIACAARASRRVLPLIDATQESQLRHQACVAVAECFAAGEPIDFAHAHDVIVPRSLREAYATTSPAEASARRVGSAVLEAVGFVLNVNEFSASVEGASADRARQNILEAAVDAFTYAKQAVGVLETSRRPSYVSPEDHDIAHAAFSADLEILERFRVEADDWLGMPVDAADDGPFGELWRDGRLPSWLPKAASEAQRRREPNVVTAEEFAESEEVRKVAEIVCCYLDSVDDRTISAIIELIRPWTERSQKEGLTPPVFVVHAPGIEAEPAGVLVSGGATLLDELQIGGKRPENSADVAKAVRSTLRAMRAGWQYGEGAWTYAATRLAWRDGTFLQGRRAIPQPSQAVRADLRTIKAGAERDYEWLVKRTQSLEERLKSEQGWPSLS
jgi:hypothetical protein